MKRGFYKIILREEDEWTIGYYEGGGEYGNELHNDGSRNNYPWQIIGSDEIIKNSEIKRILEEIK